MYSWENDQNDPSDMLEAIRLERARAATIFGLARFPEQDELSSLLILGGTLLPDAVMILFYDQEMNKTKEPT